MRAVIAVLLTAGGFAGLFWWLQQIPPPPSAVGASQKTVRAEPPKREPVPAPVDPRRETPAKPAPEPKPEKTPSVEESDPGLGLNEEFQIGFGDLVQIEEARAELQALQEELALAEEGYLEARRQGTALQKRTAKRELELLRDKVALKVEEVARLTDKDQGEDPSSPTDSDPPAEGDKPDAESGEPG